MESSASRSKIKGNDYIYESLPEGRWIRLLRLLPGTKQDDLAFELFLTDIKDAPPYEAISYAWGNPEYHSAICCDKGIQITRSLSSALECFRLPLEPRVLWADAICINQVDKKEKSYQVNMMDVVYASAETVLIWLGQDTEGHVANAIAYIKDINNRFEGSLTEQSLESLETLTHVATVFCREELPLLTSKMELLRKLLDCPWFSRLWVLQEVALASSAILHCGTISLSFCDIVQASLVLQLRTDPSDGLQVGKIGDATTYIFCTFGKPHTWLAERPFTRILRDNRVDHAAPAMFEVLYHGSFFDATDPRDHVYALLGHRAAKTEDETIHFVEADYTLDKEVVYRTTMEQLYLQDRRLDMLSAVSHRSIASLGSQPSWLPTFDHYPKTVSLYNRVFDADLGELSKGMRVASFRGNSLHVVGLIIDKIVSVTEVFDVNTIRTNKPDVVEVCWTLAFANSDISLTSFCATLVAGRYFRAGIESCWPDFAAYCRYKGFAEATAEPAKALWDAVTENPAFGSDGKRTQFEAELIGFLHGRRFFATSCGNIGIGPSLVRPDDACCVVLGCRIPLILRPQPSDGQYQLIGACYVDELMYGEAVKASQRRGHSVLVDITIV